MTEENPEPTTTNGRRRRIAHSMEDELSAHGIRHLFKYMSWLIGSSRFSIASDGCCIDLDKLSDRDVDKIYGVYKQLLDEEAKEKPYERPSGVEVDIDH